AEAQAAETLWPDLVRDQQSGRASQDGPDETDPESSPCQRLQSAGFDDCTGLYDRLRAIATSVRYRALSESSRARFDQLVNRALDLAARQDNADGTIARFLDFLDAISRRASYLS